MCHSCSVISGFLLFSEVKYEQRFFFFPVLPLPSTDSLSVVSPRVQKASLAAKHGLKPALSVEVVGAVEEHPSWRQRSFLFLPFPFPLRQGVFASVAWLRCYVSSALPQSGRERRKSCFGV